MKTYLLIFAVGLLLGIICVFGVLYVGAQYDGRELDQKERDMARGIYGDTIDLEEVRLVFDTAYALLSPVSLGNTIHVNSSWAKIATSSDLTTPPSARHMLIHELEHVYQYQNYGWSYVVDSFFAQTYAFLVSGTRNNAYRWEDRIKEGEPWEKWNVEEQAQAIADYDRTVLSGNVLSKEDNADMLALGCVVPVLRDRYCVIRR